VNLNRFTVRSQRGQNATKTETKAPTNAQASASIRVDRVWRRNSRLRMSGGRCFTIWREINRHRRGGWKSVRYCSGAARTEAPLRSRLASREYARHQISGVKPNLECDTRRTLLQIVASPECHTTAYRFRHFLVYSRRSTVFDLLIHRTKCGLRELTFTSGRVGRESHHHHDFNCTTGAVGFLPPPTVPPLPVTLRFHGPALQSISAPAFPSPRCPRSCP
jgi:hypothetical protein